MDIARLARNVKRRYCKVGSKCEKKKKVVNPLFEKHPKQFGIGGALPPKKDVHMFVRWPPVDQIQRKRRILKQRLKVPPAVKQFSKTLDKNLDIARLARNVKRRTVKGF
ncbi:60S ribosomal protein L7a-2-like [Helianthus annuus]|uniref:60S ribosomal protein L7a-2-like n=1 Tax=Helianthus annuus TaxID=4232 RepID=UPI001652F9EB|nr:60S ribosomal protein L7a-2-like [Helianthus annuus]